MIFAPCCNDVPSAPANVISPRSSPACTTVIPPVDVDLVFPRTIAPSFASFEFLTRESEDDEYEVPSI